LREESIHTIIQQGEGLKVEFKSNFNSETIETLVAFANASGGSVFLGITDKGDVTGVQYNTETIQKWINEIKTKTVPQLIPDPIIIEYNGKHIIAFSINEYPIKPVATKGRFFIRVANSNHALSANEVANMHLKVVNESWDFYIRAGKSIDDISFSKIDETIQAIQKRNLISKNISSLEFLQKNELVKEETITNACYLLFCKEPSMFTTIQIGFFQDEITIKDDISHSGNILDQVDFILAFIKKHIKKEIIITQAKENIEHWEYPLEGIRELVMNMIIHRDYTASADSIIKIYPHHIIFFNPGTLPESISLEQLKNNDYISLPRNKQIAKIAKELGWIEKYGTGIKRVRQLFMKHGLPEPEFSCEQNGFMVKIMTSNNPQNQSQFSDKVTNKVTNNVTNKVTDKVTDNQMKILELVMQNNQISAAQMAVEIGISKRKVMDNIAKLKELQRIKRVGLNKGGYWEVII